MVLTGLERDRDRGGTGGSRAVKAAVHWERPGCAFTQSSPNLTLAAMGLHADSARPQRVSGSARTDSRSAESARSPVAAHAKFGDDSELNALTRTQWTAAFSALGCTPVCRLCGRYLAILGRPIRITVPSVTVAPTVLVGSLIRSPNLPHSLQRDVPGEIRQ